MSCTTLSSSHTQPILALYKVSYRYPNGTQALREITLDIPQGRKIAILGANGAGKSTLLLHLNGILQPQSGHILLAGEIIKYSRSFLSILRQKVGMVFQDPDTQLFSVNVFQDISFGPMNLKYPPNEVKARVEQAMAMTEISDLKGRPTHQLSYGQKKRVAIAGVLAMDPEVIILDEPTASLDPRLTEEMMFLFDKLHKAGKTMIMSTHDMDLAYQWADYCYILNRGSLVAQGLPQDIFSNQTLLQENNLQIPWILKVFFRLSDQNLVADDALLPRHEEQLLAYIDQIKKP